MPIITVDEDNGAGTERRQVETDNIREISFASGGATIALSGGDFGYIVNKVEDLAEKLGPNFIMVHDTHEGMPVFFPKKEVATWGELEFEGYAETPHQIKMLAAQPVSSGITVPEHTL